MYNADGSPLMEGTYQFVVRLDGSIVLSDQCSVLNREKAVMWSRYRQLGVLRVPVAGGTCAGE